MTDQEKLTSIISNCIRYSAIHLPDDVTEKLSEMKEEETSPLAVSFYAAMEKNLELARDTDRPCCQDTGIIQFFAQVGTRFPYLDRLNDCLRNAAALATRTTPLRPNCVEIFGGGNTGDNTGTNVPCIETELLPERRDLVLYVYMAGGGCSLPGASAVFPPLEGMDASIKFIIDRVSTYGANSCPPLYVGIGFGGSADVAAKLSKKALLRKIGTRNGNPEAAELENRLEEALNSLSIGPGGMTGKRSVMGVSVEYAGRHPASFAVGLSLGCWVHRRACIRITDDLRYEMIFHKGAII